MTPPDMVDAYYDRLARASSRSGDHYVLEL